MFRSLIRLCKRVCTPVTKSVVVVFRHVARRVQRAWQTHGTRVATDSVYAAVTAVVLGGVLGVVPLKEVLSALLAAALGVFAKGCGSSEVTYAACGMTLLA